jgi:hypothetical protein
MELNEYLKYGGGAKVTLTTPKTDSYSYEAEYSCRDYEEYNELDQDNDPVNHPKHYTDHPSGIECIQITEHMGFNLGNALKYIWRCDLKKDAIEDLEKAKWYIERELKKRRND